MSSNHYHFHHPYPKDRNEVIVWAKRLLASNKWVLLDTESTGLGYDDEVIQIGILAPDGKTVFDSLVKPKKTYLENGVERIHGITTSLLDKAPTYLECREEIEKVLTGKTVIAYNAGFEERILQQTAEAWELVPLSLNIECAMLKYSSFVGQPCAPGKSKYKWQKLPRPSQHGKEYHDALTDCHLTLELIRTIANALV